MKVAQQRDFYRMRDMTEEDIALIHAAFIAPMVHQVQRESAERWIEVFTQLTRARKALERFGIDATSVLEPMYIEAEEKLHGQIERNGLPLLNKLLDSENFNLTDDEYLVFVHYLMTQYFRTSRILANTQRGLSERFPGRVERSMGLLRHMFATTSGFTLYAERHTTMKPVLLLNKAGVPLITGDQPVINTLAVDLPDEEMVEHFEAYYPLSPQKALVVGGRDRFPRGEISERAQAQEFNRMIAVAAERQVFGAQKADLDEVLELVGRHVALH